jgi:predicted nucleic acid-binding protein
LWCSIVALSDYSHTQVAQDALDCNGWVRALLANGAKVFVPEIADYEVRRELLRVKIVKGIIRLETLVSIPGITYLPITTEAMRLAAEFWAQSRQSGRPTADPKELDGDVIIAAQARATLRADDDLIVATTNPGHLSRFVPAAHWRDIPATMEPSTT